MSSVYIQLGLVREYSHVYKECIGFLFTSVSDTVTVASCPGSVISVEITDDEDLSSGGRDLSSDLCISVTWGEDCATGICLAFLLNAIKKAIFCSRVL